MTEYNDCVLDNGLKIIQEPAPTNVVYCGLFVDAGTRNEEDADSGLAHFCEHTSFKGTSKRKAWQIRNCLESVGGDLNAYTNKEETVYYATVGKEYFDRAAALLFDIVFRSVYPARELEKEREVIIDEIDCYNDSPAELIYDEFEEMVFRGHGLGRNILGEASRLRSYSTTDALRFTKRYYIPSNATFFVYGNVAFDHVCKLASRFTAEYGLSQVRKDVRPLPRYEREDRVASHQTHQAHVLIGNRAYSSRDKRRMPLALLNNILGGPGMNSLLNVALREKNGLVYSAESTSFCYTDSGVWSVYFGCEETDVAKCRKIVSGLLEKLTDKPLSESRLNKAKKQFTGQIRIAADNFESHALALGKIYAREVRHRNVERICDELMLLSALDLHEVACDIFRPDKLTTLVYK